ncbi:MAG: glucose-1-phosphate adenylyltransferase [Defluviitaleaceae bacterium]|nr:glucose-1-phosphate adenylyltransferase [Defluviitaleaceae bacterium]
MRKKEMLAMLLAGGQGSRLGVLTKNKAKPAVTFGGKYRIIDFPMSNCINSGVDTVGVLTQYQPLQLNRHIGIGIPWDLDRKNGGVTILAPHVKDGEEGHWYSGTANAIYQNINFIDTYNPIYVLVLSGDHIYKMDYARMLRFHKKNNCDATIAVLEVPIEEANRFGIMNADENDKIYEFEEKPPNPKSNLASMGIYIFTWDKLRAALIEANNQYEDLDFGKHIIPMFLDEGEALYAYRFKDYWKDVGTIESYWTANMELIKTMPEFNLYEEQTKIYTSADHQPPQFTGADADVKRSLVSEGCEVFGSVYDSTLGPDVIIESGAVIRDSIIMANCVIGENTVIDRCIIDENCTIGANVKIGMGENVPNKRKPKIYDTGITVIAENSIIPDDVVIGKNCVICGNTTMEHYENARLESGDTIELDGEVIL